MSELRPVCQSREIREIVVLSGKGGAGKTSLTGAFASLARDVVLCDLDVDAPDLHLLLAPDIEREESFHSGHEAVIDPARCTGCGLCADLCRFGAPAPAGDVFAINPLRCEGCKVCVAMCPDKAIDFPSRHCGQRMISATRFGPLVHAQLFPGQENSGRLVTLLKNEARTLAESLGRTLILSDGAPGIGCPVISSLSGAHLAVLVTEPTPSGRHDLERVAELCDHFRIKVAVVVNKCDLNPAESAAIESLCRDKGYALAAKLPHDLIVTRAMVAGKVVTELPDSTFARAARKAWENIETIAGLALRGSEPVKQP